MKEMLGIEDSQDGIFIVYKSSKRRLCKLVGNESDAKTIIRGFNTNLKTNNFIEQAESWLKLFILQYDESDRVDNFTKETAKALLNILNDL